MKDDGRVLSARVDWSAGLGDASKSEVCSMSSMREVVETDQEMCWFDRLRDEGTVETDVIGVSGTPSESTLQAMREIQLWVSWGFRSLIACRFRVSAGVGSLDCCWGGCQGRGSIITIWDGIWCWDVLSRWSRFQCCCASCGLTRLPLHHVKLHGTLFFGRMLANKMT